MIKKLLILFVLLPVVSGFPANAQENEKSDEIGIYGLYQNTYHDVDFGTLPGVPGCCPKYENTTGSGFTGGLFYKAPLSGVFSLQFRAGYSTINGDFTKQEYIGNAYDENLNTTEAISEHTLSTTLNMVEITPMISANIGDFPLSLNLGLQAGFFLSGDYEQKEELIAPSTAIFSDGLDIHNENSGTIEELSSPFLAAYLSANYKFKLGEKFNLYPEVGYSYNFTDVLSGRGWNINSLRAGLLLSMNLAEPEPDIVPLAKPILFADVFAKGLQEGKEEDIAIFKVEEFLSRQLYPLLPYVFFSENSGVIPPRYMRLSSADTKDFNINEQFYDSDAMTVYHDILNIVGKRLQENPDADLRLVGCNSDTRSEKGNESLSVQRAEAVKSYLTDRWNIDVNRISIEARNLPEKETSGSTETHQQENRRVEMYSNDPDILKPILVYDTLRVTNPPGIKFYMEANAEAGLYSWNLDISQDSEKGRQQLKKLSGFSELDNQLTWNLRQEKQAIPRTEQPLDFNLTVNDKNDSTVKAEGSIPVEQITIQKKKKMRIDDKEIDEYRLIMFDFDKPELISGHENTLDIVCENVTNESTVKITGYTDLLGPEDYNRELSQQRAEKVKEALPCAPKTILTTGEGEAELYDNITPEGRFYSRTVEVRVETPVEYE